MSNCECASFPLGFSNGIWNLVVLVPDHFLSFFFPETRLNMEWNGWLVVWGLTAL